MPATSREDADEALATAIASGKNFTQAAAVVGLSTQTVRRRMQDPEFRAMVEEFKSEMVSEAIALLGRTMSAAAEELAKLLAGSEDEKVRLAAAKEILGFGLKAREQFEIEKEMRDLRDRLDKLTPKGNGRGK